MGRNTDSTGRRGHVPPHPRSAPPARAGGLHPAGGASAQPCSAWRPSQPPHAAGRPRWRRGVSSGARGRWEGACGGESCPRGVNRHCPPREAPLEYSGGLALLLMAGELPLRPRSKAGSGQQEPPHRPRRGWRLLPFPSAPSRFVVLRGTYGGVTPSSGAVVPHVLTGGVPPCAWQRLVPVWSPLADLCAALISLLCLWREKARGLFVRPAPGPPAVLPSCKPQHRVFPAPQ